MASQPDEMAFYGQFRNRVLIATAIIIACSLGLVILTDTRHAGATEQLSLNCARNCYKSTCRGAERSNLLYLDCQYISFHRDANPEHRYIIPSVNSVGKSDFIGDRA